jgi:flagellar biosynthesis component FlhA
MRASIEETYGLRVPGIRVRANEDIPDGTYIIILEEIPLVSGKVDPRKLLCLAPVAQLPHPGPEGEGRDAPKAEPATVPDGSERAASWIPLDWADKVHAAGFETWDGAAYIEAHLRSVIVSHLNLLAHLDEVEGRLAGLDGADAVLSRLRAARGGLPRFVEVLRSLLSERMPVTPIEPLAQRYLAVADGPTVEASEEMRLAPAGRAHLTRDLADWRIFTLDEAFEAALQEGIIREGDGATLALQPELTQKLLTAVKNLVQPARNTANGIPCVLVVEDWRARPFVQSLLVLELPWLRVVARREIEGLANVPLPLGSVAVAS